MVSLVISLVSPSSVHSIYTPKLPLIGQQMSNMM